MPSAMGAAPCRPCPHPIPPRAFPYIFHVRPLCHLCGPCRVCIAFRRRFCFPARPQCHWAMHHEWHRGDTILQWGQHAGDASHTHFHIFPRAAPLQPVRATRGLHCVSHAFLHPRTPPCHWAMHHGWHRGAPFCNGGTMPDLTPHTFSVVFSTCGPPATCAGHARLALRFVCVSAPPHAPTKTKNTTNGHRGHHFLAGAPPRTPFFFFYYYFLCLGVENVQIHCVFRHGF